MRKTTNEISTDPKKELHSLSEINASPFRHPARSAGKKKENGGVTRAHPFEIGLQIKDF
jgi:hypothetical protein